VRSTKETIKTVRDMGIEQAYEYIQAKSEQLRYRDTEGTRAKGLKGFLDDKSYKPGERAVPLG
jgi:trans-feruloyl-CoA hydratase/vanillin synthase